MLPFDVVTTLSQVYCIDDLHNLKTTRIRCKQKTVTPNTALTFKPPPDWLGVYIEKISTELIIV